MQTKYGILPEHQIASAKNYIRKSIFFLLLYVDPDTRDQYTGINVDDAFVNMQDRLIGLNSILLEPPELVMVMSLLETAKQIYDSNDFDFRHYRKLVLDAGSEIMKVKESD